MRWSRYGLLSVVVVAIAVATGCKPSNPWENPHPVSGSVTYKGKPVGDAELTLFPVDPTAPESVRPRARTSADGKFTVWTYQEGDGAPAGQYKVTVVHNEVSVSKNTIVAKPNDLPPKYSRRDSTDLQVTITAGKNDLPALELR